MDHTLKVTIPYEAGLSDTEMLLKVTRAVTDAASKKKGWRAGGYTPDRDFSDVRDALQRNKRNQTVTLTKTRSGITARRVRASPSVAIADASGALDLEAAARKFTPELTGFALSQMADKLGARKTALDTAIYGTPGLDRSMRLSAISGAGDDGAMAKVVGYEPNRGTRIDSMAAGKLKALIQKVMLDLNVSTGDKRTKEAQELLERSFRTKFTLLEQDLVDEFRLMIKAYHEVRLMNLPYIESMMVGMDGAEFPDVLLSMLAPSPDDFLQGTDAMLIIDSKNRPEEQRIMFSSITDTILSLWSRILNTREKDKPVLNTDKQQEVASLLSAFKNDRTKMVRAIETACRKARRRGGDFIDAFTPYPLIIPPVSLEGGEKRYVKDLKDLVVKAADNAINEGGPLYQLDFGTNDAKAEAIFNEMEGKGLSNRIGDTEYFIVPMSMPRFSTRPIGWDRRWMVATMRIVDEYWNILYSENGMFITDLLYLISSRAYELFNYTMDAEDLYLLTLLLVGEEGVEAADVVEAVEEAKSGLEEVAEAVGEALVDTGEPEPAENKKEGEEEEEAEDFDEEAFDGEISADDLESIDLGDGEIEILDEDEGDEDPMAGMGTGASRRARRGLLERIGSDLPRKKTKFASGILPTVSGARGKRLKTIGDMLGISGVAKGLNKEITELERKLRERNTDFEKQTRKLKSLQGLYADTENAFNKSLALSRELQEDKVAFETKRAELEQQLRMMGTIKDMDTQKLAEQRSRLEELTSTLGTRDKRIQGLKDLIRRKNLDLAFAADSYDDLFASSGEEIAQLTSVLNERQNLISTLREGLEEERVAMNELSTKTTEEINDLNEALAKKEITVKEHKKRIAEVESDYDKELKRAESLTEKVNEKADQLLAVEKQLALTGADLETMTASRDTALSDLEEMTRFRDAAKFNKAARERELQAILSQQAQRMEGLTQVQKRLSTELGDREQRLLETEAALQLSREDLAALDASTTAKIEGLVSEIAELEEAQVQALEQQKESITAQADKAIDEYVEELQRVKEEKTEEVRKALQTAAIAENKLQSSRGLGADMMMDRIQELESLISQMTPEQSENIRAKDVRNLTAPIVMDQAELTRLLEKPNRTLDELKNYAKHIFYMDNVDQYKNKKALTKAIYSKYRASRQLLREIKGERRGRKARSAQAIKVTRADGSGKDLGLVTAEVMVGVNIISDIKTGIRDVFGGRSKSGQVKLQDAMNILIEELKTRASAMGATSISHFHAEPFVYGGSGSIIGLYGYGVARKGGTRKASMAFKMEEEREIQVEARKADVEAFTEKYLDTVIRNRMTTNEFEVSPNEIAYENEVKKVEYDADYQALMKKFHPKAIYDGRDNESVEARKLINEHLQDLYGFSDIILMSKGTLRVTMRGQGARRKAKRKARSAEVVDLLLPLTGAAATLFAQRMKSWWQARKGTLPATQKDLSSLATVEDMEGVTNEAIAGVRQEMASLVSSFNALQDELNNSQTPQLAAAAAAAELPQQIPPAELEQAYEILDREVPEIAEEVQDLTENLEDTRPFMYWTPFGFLSITVPDMEYEGNPFAMRYFEYYTGEDGTHIEVTDDTSRLVAGGRISPDARYVFPTNAGLLFKCQDRVMDIFGNRAYNATQDEKYEELYFEAAEVFGFLDQIDWGSRRARSKHAVTKNPPSERKYKGMIIKKSGKMWNVEAFDKDFKTLKGARDFISKKVSGAASANGPCPRVIGKTKCKGTVILVRNRWKCKACKAEFREA